MAAALTWTLFAFGGAFAWTLVPSAAAVLVAASGNRLRIAARGRRSLDIALLCCLGWVVLQLVPIPLAWRTVLSPHAGDIDEAIRFAGLNQHTASLSIDPAATLKAAAVAALTMTTFWTARATLTYGVLRNLARPIAWSGLVVSVMAIALRVSSPSSHLIYGLWYAGSTAYPYGPFVYKGNLGTWLIMAVPLTTGYAIARVYRHSSDRSIAASFDTPMVWLIGSAGAMVTAAIVSLSRSTAVGLGAAAVFAAAVALRRTPRAAGWVALAAAATVAIVLSRPESVDLAERFQKPEFTETWARPQIWRETVPIVRDFALTGTGLGAYRTAMLLYQKTDRTFFFNQAHNQYLQLAAEGGIMLLVPLAFAALVFAATVTRRLRSDVSALFWIRAGATAGIVGTLVQSVWETGLRMPANALLLALLCAIAVHEPHR